MRNLYRWMAVLACSTTLVAQPAPRPPREIYNSLNALRVDAARTYYVRELTLRRDVVRLAFQEGKLAFLQAYDGRVLGAVFTGRGQALAAPRDPIEKRSLARFLDTPLLDQTFTRAYLRFTDDAAEDLLRQLEEKKTAPLADASFAAEWDSVVANMNPWHSLRTLTELISPEPRPYFYGGLLGDRIGPFDVMVDDRREEQISLGQPHWVSGARYYDSWASFSRANAEPWTPAFRAHSYAVDTAIQADRSLEGSTLAEISALRAGERVIVLELSRNLKVQSVADEAGRPVEFFQNEELTRSQVSERGNDFITVLLPEAPRPGEHFRLRVRYRGTVISDAGNGVYFVGERGSWYAHLAGADQFVAFDLSFRWPRRLTLVATGERQELREEGDWRSGRWRSKQPMPVAGFNLGDYESETVQVEAGRLNIELYANKNLEMAVLQRFVRPGPPPQLPRPQIGAPRSQVSMQPRLVLPDPPAPTPAAILKQLGGDIAEAVRFHEKFSGPFPFEHLSVAQIPGSFGQGWPTLLYLSTLSFLTPSQQSRAGIGTRIQEQFLDLVPAHEVAHQWWGNVVGWSSYRDQWIHEGLANYLALLYADGKRPGENVLTEWLTLYRDDLIAPEEDGDRPLAEAGPLVLGNRLRSSKSPLGYPRIVYGKGSWVFHMLRTMLRDPASKTPDARFARLLAVLLEKHKHRALTTEDLRAAVEKVMTPAMDLERTRSMDWFFDQWVSGTEIPRYSVEFSVKPAANPANGFVVRGTLKQTGVPEHFVASVPLYAPRASGKPALLGNVTTTGPETKFQFTARSAPKKLLIDPNLTLLCVTE